MDTVHKLVQWWTWSSSLRAWNPCSWAWPRWARLWRNASRDALSSERCQKEIARFPIRALDVVVATRPESIGCGRGLRSGSAPNQQEREHDLEKLAGTCSDLPPPRASRPIWNSYLNGSVGAQRFHLDMIQMPLLTRNALQYIRVKARVTTMKVRNTPFYHAFLMLWEKC